MADNTVLNIGSGGDTIATEDIGGVKHELVMVEFSDGAGGATKVSAADPLPVSATINTAGLATEAKQDDEILALNSIAAEDFATSLKQDSIITALALLLTITDFDTKTGSLTETAPATDTASSGLNGRLQRIAQRLTSLIALFPAALGAGGGLKVDGSGTPLAVSGTVAVTGAGDASAANQATQITAEEAIQAAVQIMDDWDESDRAKVNLIAGQVGILGGTGTDAANVPRVSLVTNVALPAGTNLLGKTGIDQTTDGTTNKVRATATQKPSIGATVVLAVTALQSLASSATVGWKSVRTSNLATLATDYEVMVSLNTANTAPANDKAMYVFVIPWYTTDAGTTWFASSGGTATLPTSADATYTIASPHNFRLLGVLNYTTQQMVVQDTFLLSNCFGNRLPDGFSFCIINFSGAALSTTCIVDITPINDILV